MTTEVRAEYQAKIEKLENQLNYIKKLLFNRSISIIAVVENIELLMKEKNIDTTDFYSDIDSIKWNASYLKEFSR